MKTIESYRDNQERLDYITSEAAENMIDDAEKFLRDFGWDKTDDAPDMPGSPHLRQFLCLPVHQNESIYRLEGASHGTDGNSQKISFLCPRRFL